MDNEQTDEYFIPIRLQEKRMRTEVKEETILKLSKDVCPSFSWKDVNLGRVNKNGEPEKA